MNMLGEYEGPSPEEMGGVEGPESKNFTEEARATIERLKKQGAVRVAREDSSGQPGLSYATEKHVTESGGPENREDLPIDSEEALRLVEEFQRDQATENEARRKGKS